MTSLGLPPPAYLDTCPELPADAPAGHPHLIDCSQPTASKSHHLADVIATVLYNWKPEALHAFLYLDKETFVFKIEQPKGSKQIDYVIARTGSTVMVSGIAVSEVARQAVFTYKDHHNSPSWNRLTSIPNPQFGGYKPHRFPDRTTISYAWHYHIRYTIQKSGLWMPTYAIGRGFGGTLFGEPIMGDEGRYGDATRDARWVDALAHQYGKILFVDKVWLEMEGVRKSLVVE